MLDVRITAYIVPIAEQPQASLTPVISVRNYADEGAVITGLIRIYRESTGLLIWASELAVTQLNTMTSANIAALTPFDPPAPADDDYFVKADIVATSYLPGPPITATLGAWHFDIKTPPMGEAPAGHHVTHENGGSDEVTIEGLDGHPGEAGQVDGLAELDGAGLVPVDQLGTGAPDGTKYLRDDQTYATPPGGGVTGISVKSEFLTPLSNYGMPPWYAGSLASGTGTFTGGIAGHPGIHRMSSSTSANSGWRYYTNNVGILIAGGEWSQCIYRPQTLALTTLHFGFSDGNSATVPVDGVWLWQDPATGIVYGRTRANSVGSQTATGFQLVTNTWYRLKILLNADATLASYFVYDMDGNELWTDTLAANIPTGAGRYTGHALIISNSGTTALALGDFDYMDAHFEELRNLD